MALLDNDPATAKKPAEMKEKIVMGKINKWYKEVCLIEQPWILDEKSTLGKIAPKLTVKRFVRWEVGKYYRIYADAYSTYSSMPFLNARYTYTK